MSKFILAFLAVAATAAGQDVVIPMSDYITLGDHQRGRGRDEPLAYPRDVRGLGRTVSRGINDWYSFRMSVLFDLSAVDAPVSSAILRWRPDRASSIGRAPLHEDIFVTFRHSEAYRYERLYGDIFRQEFVDQWEDMGDGEFYGANDVSESIDNWRQPPTPYWDPPEFIFRSFVNHELIYLETPLSALAVKNINASIGGGFGIGISLPSLDLPPFGRGPTESTGVGIDELSLLLTYGPPPPLGDFNGTGRVDQADLDFVLLNWGLVDQEELDAVLLTWGQGAALGSAAVPEPATWLLAAFCVILAAGSLSWSRRRCTSST